MRANLIIIGISIVLLSAAVTVVFKTVDYYGVDAQSGANIPDYRYHFIFIARSTESNYWKQVYSGMAELIRREQIGLEFHGVNLTDPEELQRILEMSVLSNSDGILVSLPNGPEYRRLIAEAISKGIPMVTFNDTIGNFERLSFVGISSRDLGYKTGLALRDAVSKPVKVALLINYDDSENSYRQYLQGIHKALAGHPEIQIKLVISSKGDSISAEDQTQTIIKRHPDIQAIVCSDPSDTLGVAKLVVDLNQVSRITIVGRGLTAEIANYIKRGVIRSVLADDPNELGVQGLSVLIRLKKDRAQSENYSQPLFLIRADNVDYFFGKFFPRDEKIK
jgi:ribose transport system substrate-binding protein